MYNSQHWKREYDYSQKQNHSLDTFNFESDDRKYFASFSMVDFGSDGDTSRYMWCVDCHTPKTYCSDEELFSNYYDAKEWFEDLKQEIMEYNLKIRQETMSLLGV